MNSTGIVSMIERAEAESSHCWGIRAIYGEEEVEVGMTLGPSYNWVDGEPDFDSPLSGTCACGIADRADGYRAEDVEVALDRAYSYMGGRAHANGWRLALLRSEYACGGDDIGEVVMSDAVVEAVWDARVVA